MMQQQETFDFPTPPLAHVEKMMPHDARIREVYSGGKGITLTARELGIGRRAVELAVHRMGIVRTEAQAKNERIDWDMAVALYKAGHGTKYIARACGTTNHVSIRAGLIKRGVYEHNRETAKGNETWAGYTDAEIVAHGRIERAHDQWWRSAFKRQKAKADALAYYYAHHDEMKEKCRVRAMAKYYVVKDTPEYIAAKSARRTLKRIARSVGLKRKTDRTHKYLGCTFKEAADYLESMFRDGMSWANYGKYWEIDHIIPLSAFDLMDENQMRYACHYSNLQPLTVRENRSKPDGLHARAQRIGGATP